MTPTLHHSHLHRMPDGAQLALHDWPLPAPARRASVLLVHGLGEHALRYRALAEQLNAWGLAVRGYDHYGHGQSSGPRGGLARDDQLVEHLGTLIDTTRAGLAPGEPLVLLGHSMGGLVAAALVARALRPVDALVLSSPALALRTSALQRLLLATLPALLPNLRIANGLDPDDLSHDAAQVAAYRADPINHDRLSARLARFLATEGARVMAQAPHWRVPTLLLWGEADRIVDPQGCARFAQAAPQAVLTARSFAGLYHELFREADPAPALAALRHWLRSRLAATPLKPVD